jgi:hypothetical protein
LPDIRIDLKSLVLSNGEIGNLIRDSGTRTDQRLDSIAAAVVPYGEKVDELHKFMQRMQISSTVPAAQQNSQSSLGSVLEAYTQGGTAITPRLKVQTSVYSQSCGHLCRCRCHTESTFTSPRWLRIVLGSLFVGYAGVPGLHNVSCDDEACQQAGHGCFKVAYHFPAWFLTRMITIQDRWSPLGGHIVSMRTPRVVSPKAEIFIYAQQGNIEGLQLLFKERKASPFDVSSSEGRSALHVSCAPG